MSATDPVIPESRRLSGRIRRALRIGLVVSGLLLAVVFYLAWKDLGRVEMGEKLPHVSWLPASATNVSYYRSYMFQAYEFDISEAEFLKWARRYEIRPVREPFSIPRYTTATVPRPAYPDNGDEDELARYLDVQDELKALRNTTVEDGYFYERERGQSGGFTRVAWDRTTGRAYFQSNPR